MGRVLGKWRQPSQVCVGGQQRNESVSSMAPLCGQARPFFAEAASIQKTHFGSFAQLLWLSLWTLGPLYKKIYSLIDPRPVEMHPHKTTRERVFTAAPFTVMKRWKWPSVHARMNRETKRGLSVQQDSIQPSKSSDTGYDTDDP